MSVCEPTLAPHWGHEVIGVCSKLCEIWPQRECEEQIKHTNRDLRKTTKSESSTALDADLLQQYLLGEVNQLGVRTSKRICLNDR